MIYHPNVFGILLLQAAAGGAFLLTFLYRFPSINRTFYRMHGLLFLLFSGGALFALGPSNFGTLSLRPGHLDQLAVILMILGTAGLVLYNLLINFFPWARVRSGGRPVLVLSSLLLLGATGTAALLMNASLALSGSGVLLLASMFVSAFLLGSVVLAMNWGHFYLTNPTLPIEPLAFLARALLGFMGATAGLTMVMTYLDWQASEGFARGLLLESFQGLYLWGRLLIGVVGGLAISILAFRTVRMHSTQAATGLLYVALLMILFGEAFSRFLFLNLGILL